MNKTMLKKLIKESAKDLLIIDRLEGYMILDRRVIIYITETVEEVLKTLYPDNAYTEYFTIEKGEVGYDNIAFDLTDYNKLELDDKNVYSLTKTPFKYEKLGVMNDCYMNKLDSMVLIQSKYAEVFNTHKCHAIYLQDINNSHSVITVRSGVKDIYCNYDDIAVILPTYYVNTEADCYELTPVSVPF